MTSVVSKAGSCPPGDALNHKHDDGASSLTFVCWPPGSVTLLKEFILNMARGVSSAAQRQAGRWADRGRRHCVAVRDAVNLGRFCRQQQREHVK